MRCWISVVVFLSFPVYSFANDRIEGFSFDSAKFRVLARKNNDVIETYLRLPGRLSREDWGLLAETEKVKLAQDGSFQIVRPIKNNQVEVDFTAIDPMGRVHREKIVFHVSGVNELRDNAEAVFSKTQKDRPRVFTSLGLSSILYNESGVDDYSTIGSTLKIAYQREVFSPRWEAGANAFLTFFPISSSRSDISARFFGANLRFGYSPPFMQEPWRFTLLTGLYYARVFVTNNVFGYRNLLYPQIYPALKRKLSSKDTLSAYLKYVPLGSSFFNLSLNERELAIGCAWQRTLGNSHPIQVALDISDLQLNASKSIAISSRSISISGGYGW